MVLISVKAARPKKWQESCTRRDNSKRPLRFQPRGLKTNGNRKPPQLFEKRISLLIKRQCFYQRGNVTVLHVHVLWHEWRVKMPQTKPRGQHLITSCDATGVQLCFTTWVTKRKKCIITPSLKCFLPTKGLIQRSISKRLFSQQFFTLVRARMHLQRLVGVLCSGCCRLWRITVSTVPVLVGWLVGEKASGLVHP